MILWEIDIYPAEGQPDRLGSAVAGDALDLGLSADLRVRRLGRDQGTR